MAKSKARKNKPAESGKAARPQSGEAAAGIGASSSADAEGGKLAQTGAGTNETFDKAVDIAAESAAENKQGGSAGNKSSQSKKREVVYQLKTKRTSGIIKAYITFTYRIMHPGVTPRLILYGLLVAAPGIFFFKDLYWKVFFTAVGAAMVLLGFFRQYISLAMTKKNDPDYKSGVEFRYDFRDTDAFFYKGDTVFSKIGKYKDVTAFYYDDKFYYLALAKELHVLPKSAFTIGTPEGFEEFIYKKSRKTCRWLPDNFSDQLKKRRAERAVMSGNAGSSGSMGSTVTGSSIRNKKK